MTKAWMFAGTFVLAISTFGCKARKDPGSEMRSDEQVDSCRDDRLWLMKLVDVLQMSVDGSDEAQDLLPFATAPCEEMAANISSGTEAPGPDGLTLADDRKLWTQLMLAPVKVLDARWFVAKKQALRLKPVAMRGTSKSDFFGHIPTITNGKCSGDIDLSEHRDSKNNLLDSNGFSIGVYVTFGSALHIYSLGKDMGTSNPFTEGFSRTKGAPKWSLDTEMTFENDVLRETWIWQKDKMARKPSRSGEIQVRLSTDHTQILSILVTESTDFDNQKKDVANFECMGPFEVEPQ